MVIQIIKFKSELSEEEVFKVADERKPQFQAIKGLVQKYYVKDNKTGEYGGIYIWDSEESLKSYRQSELASSIPKAYKIIGSPTIEVLNLVYPLRD